MNKNTTLGWFDSALCDHEGILALAPRAGRVGLWSRNLLTDRSDWSAVAHEIFGTNPNTYDSSTAGLLSLIDPEDRDTVRQSVRDAITNHTELIVEFRIHPVNGDVRWIWTQGHAVYDATGKATQMVGVAADITERKRAETTRSHLAAIVESSGDAIISQRLDLTIISWNAAAQQLFGYTAGEIIGQSIVTIVPPELRHEETEMLARIRRGERIDHYETIRLTKSGRRMEVSVSVSPVRDEQGRVVGASKIARDIGSLRAAQKAMADELAARAAAEAALRETESKLRPALVEREQLLESERSARSEAERLGHMKGEFLATLSHELRTPLNAIKGWATLLKQPNLAASDRGPGLDAIERNARAQAQIINDLLDMNRIVAGKFHLDVQAVHLHEVIHASIEAVRPSAEAKRLRIRTILDSGVGTTRGDPNRLQQVMWNLLTNAVKFTPAGGSIQIVLERVHSQVGDHGRGHRRGHLARISAPRV